MRHRQRGQTLPVLVLVLLPITGVALAVTGAARLVADQTRLQAAVDAAAYSGAAMQAETLNGTAVANRTLVAHLVTAGQVTSAVAHLRALARAARAAQAVGVAFPVLAPALGLVGQGADAAAQVAAGVAHAVVPLARGASAVEVGRARAALLAADTRLASRVDARLRGNAPDARLTAASAASLRSAPLARAVGSARPGDLVAVAGASVDAFTAGRQSRPPLGRTWRIARVGKSGSTRLGEGAGLAATDTIGVDLVRGTRFGATVRVTGAEFGHGAVHPGWQLRRAARPAAVRIEATLVSIGGRRLTARAAAAAVYRRPGRTDESPDLFGPFWRPRLVPFHGAATPGRSRSTGR